MSLVATNARWTVSAAWTRAPGPGSPPGRVSAVAVDSAGHVYVFHRGKKADPIVVFDSKGQYLRSWGRGVFGNPHGLRIDRQNHESLFHQIDDHVLVENRAKAVGRVSAHVNDAGRAAGQIEVVPQHAERFQIVPIEIDRMGIEDDRE